MTCDWSARLVLVEENLRTDHGLVSPKKQTRTGEPTVSGFWARTLGGTRSSSSSLTSAGYHGCPEIFACAPSSVEHRPPQKLTRLTQTRVPSARRPDGT